MKPRNIVTVVLFGLYLSSTGCSAPPLEKESIKEKTFSASDEVMFGLSLGSKNNINWYLDYLANQDLQIDMKSGGELAYTLFSQQLNSYMWINDAPAGESTNILAFPLVYSTEDINGEELIYAISITLANDKLNSYHLTGLADGSIKRIREKRLYQEDIPALIYLYSSKYGEPTTTFPSIGDNEDIPVTSIWKLNTMVITLKMYYDFKQKRTGENADRSTAYLVEVWYSMYDEDYKSKFGDSATIKKF